MMTSNLFICKRCGHCCTELIDAYEGTMSDDEFEQMLEQAPPSMHARLLSWVSHVSFLGIYDYWIDPKTGEDAGRCPWLRFHRAERYKNKGAFCSIQKYKPPVCRDYPKSLRHALISGCKGYNHLPQDEIRKYLVRRLVELLGKLIS